MNLADRLKSVIRLLDERKAQYALAGGLVASLYRREPRMTQDLDIVILHEPDSGAVATEILRALELEPHPLSNVQLEGGPLHAIKMKRSPIYMLAGRSAISGNIGVDFILPDMPWAKRALERAQYHQVDFGFGELPCLTVEDLILAKLYSLDNRADRFSDLDDLQKIFQSDEKFDLGYLSDRMMEQHWGIPKALKEHAPKELLRISKIIKKGKR